MFSMRTRFGCSSWEMDRMERISRAAASPSSHGINFKAREAPVAVSASQAAHSANFRQIEPLGHGQMPTSRNHGRSRLRALYCSTHPASTLHYKKARWLAHGLSPGEKVMARGRMAFRCWLVAAVCTLAWAGTAWAATDESSLR